MTQQPDPSDTVPQDDASETAAAEADTPDAPSPAADAPAPVRTGPPTDPAVQASQVALAQQIAEAAQEAQAKRQAKAQEQARVAEPVRPPRFEGFDMDQAIRLLAHLDLELARDRGDFQYRFASIYMDRAHLRFAAGFAPQDILDDFWLASRILALEAIQHLERTQPQQLKTRRIIPLEAGIIGGQLDIARRLANSCGLPLITARAGLGGQALATEMRILSPGLLDEYMTQPQHVLGLAASVYAAALGSTIRGYADEVKLALQVLAKANFKGELSNAHKAIMIRYGGLCEVLLELVQPGQRNLPAILADQANRYTAQLAMSLGDQFLHPTSPVRYIDTSSLALIGMSQLIGYPLENFPPDPEATPFAVGYADFIASMQEPRVVEEDEEMRAQINTIIEQNIQAGAAALNPNASADDAPADDAPADNADDTGSDDDA